MLCVSQLLHACNEVVFEAGNYVSMIPLLGQEGEGGSVLYSGTYY